MYNSLYAALAMLSSSSLNVTQVNYCSIFLLRFPATYFYFAVKNDFNCGKGQNKNWNQNEFKTLLREDMTFTKFLFFTMQSILKEEQCPG